METFYKYPDDDYNAGVFMQEYRGEWSFVSAWKEQGSDDIKMKWCYPQKGREPASKGLPWKIKLGSDKQAAAKCLRYMLEKLTGHKVTFGDKL